MTLPEVEAGRDLLFEAVGGVVAATSGLGAAQLNWRPASEGNSLFVLATHILGGVEEALLTGLCKTQTSDRDREAEFLASGDAAEQFVNRWQALRATLTVALDGLSRDDLEAMQLHPRRGEMTGYMILLQTVAHAHEHRAHAELTRQLLEASR